MGKKVISFSLFGKHPTYTQGAIANARHANRAYPGWVCRFYVADDVPEGIIARLKDYDAEVVNMGRNVSNEAMFWRFFATVDPENEVTLIRDADSRFTKCELLMVNEWLASGKKFHVMRWDKYYPPIMGGLWGVRGAIPSLREPLERSLRLAVGTGRNTDQNFLTNNLYPQMKGNVFVHETESQVKRRYFVGETIHPFPPIAKDKRGKYLNSDFLPVGMRMPSGRNLVVLSVYKRTPLSEYFLAQLLASMETWDLSYLFHIRFYVADNISPGLIERLRRHGRVILKPAKTVRKDDPHYWKLLILSEKNIGLAAIVDFWRFFLLAYATRRKQPLGLSVSLPIEYGLFPGNRKGFTYAPTLGVSGPVPPISDIENLIARRDPNMNYREFINSTVYPLTSTTRLPIVLRPSVNISFKDALAGVLLPLWLYKAAKYLYMPFRGALNG